MAQADNPRASLSKVDSFQYPAAHLGHLSDVQQTALDKFKQLCQDQGYYHPAGTDERKHSSHDDETLLRYLRARNFSPEAAFGQFKDTEEWRKENHLEQYYDQIEISEYDATRRLYPQWTGRRDKRGIPVYVFQVADLNSKAISAYETSLSKSTTPSSSKKVVPPKMLRLFALYENLTRFVLPLCSAIPDRPHPETPVSQSNNIVDISNVGLKQFWNLKGHMQDASVLATAHYPETLDRIFIVGAPSFFPTVWSWIKRWFDPITVSKIFILSQQDMKVTLEKYISIENIPKRYGGTLDFEFGMMPILEPAIINALDWQEESTAEAAATAVKETVEKVVHTPISTHTKTFPAGPVKWRELGTGEIQAVAVGSEDGKRREKVIARVRTDFAALHGISRQNTMIDWSKEEIVPTTGTATQESVNASNPDLGNELEPQGVAAGETLPVRTAATDKQPEPIPRDTTSAPAKDSEPLPPSESQPRTGTSTTAYEQQESTHAEGQMASGTPHTVDYGHGDKAAVMEPSTVGQARKDVTAKVGNQEPAPAPSYVEQAKGVITGTASAASAAVSGVLASTGISGLGATEAEKKEEKKVVEIGEDSAKDTASETPGVPDRGVEEYLRDQYAASSKNPAEDISESKT